LFGFISNPDITVNGTKTFEIDDAQFVAFGENDGDNFG
jgi:hypothetical protein